jgi:uncharacterized membrane protein
MKSTFMEDLESLLNRWLSAGVLDAATVSRIRAFEQDRARQQQKSTDRKSDTVCISWQGVTALILGAILLACGVVLFVSAHWDEMGRAARFALVLALVTVFHVAGGLVRDKYRALGTALNAVGTIATGAAIALTGQIFNINEHWPAAVLLWAIAALAGWALLRDQAQQTLALLLVPAWMFCEFESRAHLYIGSYAYEGRMLFVWAILYLTFFAGSRRRVVQSVLFAVSAVASIAGVGMMVEGIYSSDQTDLPFSLRVWTWVAIAAVPLIVAAFHGHKGLVPIVAAILFTIMLPWRNPIPGYTYMNTDGYRLPSPSFAVRALSFAFAVFPHALVAAFAVFICWWGVKLGSRLLVNFGIVGFAIAVGWFYFSDILDKLSRSLGLIGLGVLFLAGGWALEKMRRRIIARMTGPVIGGPQ